MNRGLDKQKRVEAEVDTETVTHWGCQFVRADGSVYLTRWDLTYGGLHFEPYTEAEARADVVRTEELYEGMTKRLVTRTETTTIVTTPWTVVE